MIFVYFGTDRDKARAAIQRETDRLMKKGQRLVRITDAHTLPDFTSVLQGGGMFDGPRVVVFENILSHEEMGPILLDALESLAESSDTFFILEEKVDAATRKKLEKYAEKSERFDAEKGERDNEAFQLAYAMQRGDKKKLWVGYMRELAKGSAPEMIHGILFWAAKAQFLKVGNNAAARTRAAALVASLAELPHESRRKGFDLEYALERFVLSVS